ncbi:MAG: hypothetical protein ACYC27_00270 [Armatimonadota bacterium]
MNYSSVYITLAMSLMLTANVCADTVQRPLLVFEIDEGFNTSLLSRCKDNFPELDGCLDNIISSLSPLTSKYEVAVLIYPTHVYDRNGYEKSSAAPINRFHPVLKHTFEYFRDNSKIKIMLEAYSSGIETSQNGRWANVPRAPLHSNPDDKGISGWSMDLDAMAALKDAYPEVFKGVRFHEVYGSDLVHRLGNANGFFLDEEAIRGAVDVCKQKNLFLLWSDSCWLMKAALNTGQPVFMYDEKNKPYIESEPYKSLQDYAEEQLGDKLCFSWANNNYNMTQNLQYLDVKVGPSKAGVEHPISDWNYFSMPYKDFPLKNRPRAKWGVSIQSWFWHELNNQLNMRYYLLGENNCPVEVLQAYILKALHDGASVIQFEPSWYFFNEGLRIYGDNVTVCEQKSDYTERLAMKRIKHTLMNPNNLSNPPYDLSKIFDRNQQRFIENSLSDPPINFSQSTFAVFESGKSQPKCYDSYIYGPTWKAQHLDRYGSWIYDGNVISMHRIELQGDGIDEILVVKRGQNSQPFVEIFDHNSIRIGDCPGMLDDNNEGQFVTLTAANLITESTSRCDPDEIIVARRQKSGDKLNLRVYKAVSDSDGRSHVEYRPLSDEANLRIFSRLTDASSPNADFIGLLGIRNESVMYSDFTRSLDTLAVVYKNVNGLLIRTLVDGRVREWNVKGDHLLALDSNLDRKDEICAIRTSGRQSVVDVYSIDGSKIKKIETRRIPAVPKSAHVVGLRKCVLVNGE